MKPVLVAALAGVLFALGLALSGMTDPARVTGFLDVGGAWDPTLAFVMAGAILAHAPLVRMIRRRSAPLFDKGFHWPRPSRTDAALVAGAAVFGVGWGLSGYCPGPALVSLGAGARGVVVFVAAMLVAMAATHAVLRLARR